MLLIFESVLNSGSMGAIVMIKEGGTFLFFSIARAAGRSMEHRRDRILDTLQLGLCWFVCFSNVAADHNNNLREKQPQGAEMYRNHIATSVFSVGRSFICQ